VLAHCNNSPRIDMSPHLDTSFRFQANQSLLFLLNAACLAEKQHIPILHSLVWPDRGSNPRSTTLEASTLTIAPSRQWKSTVWKELLNIYNFIHSKHFLDPFRVSLKIWTGIPLLCYHFILVKAKCKSLKKYKTSVIRTWSEVWTAPQSF
jgi:hypothetical protein